MMVLAVLTGPVRVAVTVTRPPELGVDDSVMAPGDTVSTMSTACSSVTVYVGDSAPSLSSTLKVKDEPMSRRKPSGCGTYLSLPRSPAETTWPAVAATPSKRSSPRLRLLRSLPASGSVTIFTWWSESPGSGSVKGKSLLLKVAPAWRETFLVKSAEVGAVLASVVAVLAVGSGPSCSSRLRADTLT